MEKACATCGKMFTKSPSISVARWHGVKFCSRPCYAASKVGKPPPVHGDGCGCFRCSGDPWNRGLTRVEDERIARPWLGKKRSMPESFTRYWKGRRGARFKSEAKYHAIHSWLNRNHPRIGVCEICENRHNYSGRTQWAALTGTYDRMDRSEWMEMCSSCHKLYDLALKRRSRTPTPITYTDNS